MEYTEALNKKNAMTSNLIELNGIKFLVFITPKKEGDFKNYLDHFRNGRFNDVSSKDFSSNDQYKLVGIYTDGTDVIFNNL